MAQLTTRTQDAHERLCVKLVGKTERNKADLLLRRNGFVGLIRTGDFIFLADSQKGQGEEIMALLKEGARRRPKRSKNSLRVRKSGRP